MNDKIYASSFFDFCLIFYLGGTLAVMAPFYFDFNGFALNCGRDVGGSFGNDGEKDNDGYLGRLLFWSMICKY